MRIYCTYFDRDYAVRALALIDSLNRFGGAYRLYTLCLDKDSERIIDALANDHVVPVSLADLEILDQELAATKLTRSLIEYYFTITPCWPLYLFRTYSDITQLTYLDADLYFFSDPEPVFDQIGDASVALTRHNFSPDQAQFSNYFGKYNVGWITWKRDQDGLAALRWYRERCLEWCHDRVEGDKFADQKYLERIADLPNVKDVEHIGVNLGEWCCNNYQIELCGNIPMVDDLPVVCYHFQRLWQIEPDKFDCNISERHRDPISVMTTHMFRPYCELLAHFLKKVREYYPEASLSNKNRAEPDPFVHTIIELDSSNSTSHATEDTGWETPRILKARKEQWEKIHNGLSSQDPVGDTPWDHHMYICFGYVLGLVTQGKTRVSILDWGGAFGHFLLYGKRLFPDLEIDYTCKELPLMCEYGNLINRQAKFVDNDKEAFSRTYDLVLSNSVLQYCDNWMTSFEGLASVAKPWLFISRMHLVDGTESQQFTDQAYGSNVRVWLINRNEFLATATRFGFTKQQEMLMFESNHTPVGEIDGRAFLLKYTQ